MNFFYTIPKPFRISRFFLNNSLMSHSIKRETLIKITIPFGLILITKLYGSDSYKKGHMRPINQNVLHKHSVMITQPISKIRRAGLFARSKAAYYFGLNASSSSFDTFTRKYKITQQAEFFLHLIKFFCFYRANPRPVYIFSWTP